MCYYLQNEETDLNVAADEFLTELILGNHKHVIVNLEFNIISNLYL